MPTDPVPYTDVERIARLRLIRSENVGPVTFRTLLDRFGSAQAALDALPDLARQAGRSGPLRIASTETVEQELLTAESRGATVLYLGEAPYPAALAHIYDAPPVLFAVGRQDLLEPPCFAIVGGRNASIAGRAFAEKTAAELAKAGLVIASGMARGIDAAAHAGALASGTIAVMAGGADILFPPENETLFRQLGEDGLILSEMPLGTKPLARHFPRRNRIISGLSDAILVIEAKRRSGSLITARCAADQGRQVFAAPAAPRDPRGQGCNDLIRDGATLAQDSAEILQDLAPGLAPRGMASPSPAPEAVLRPNDTDLDEARRFLLDNLSGSPVPLDTVLRASSLPAQILISAATELELAGRVLRHGGGAISLAPVSHY